MRRSLIVIIALIIVVASILVVRSIQKAKRHEEHQAQYQAVLAKYSQALKSGVTRKQVEDYLRVQNVKFGQQCCNDEHHVFATVVRVGQEDPPLGCSSLGVVFFEFTAVEPERYPIRPPSDGDILIELHLGTQGETCL
jgi:hypothetical protein